MTKKKTTPEGQLENNTETDLQVLKNLEKAFFRNHPRTMKRNTMRSLRWFSQYVPKSMNRVRTSVMFRDRELWSQTVKPGRMYFYEYDAIHKATLPVWDRYPLIFPWDVWRGDNGKTYMIAINLHYLPPQLRFVAMRALLKLRTEKRFRKSVKLKMSWDILKSLSENKLFKHSIKMYRIDHVRSVFVEIPPVSWELVAFLPLARWQNGGKGKAWDIR